MHFPTILSFVGRMHFNLAKRQNSQVIKMCGTELSKKNTCISHRGTACFKIKNNTYGKHQLTMLRQLCDSPCV